jgi:KaiC/GvpD/RAD55 family RecA-like ATPase
MKFFLAEGNLGNDATREQTEKVIEMLKKKGWDVEYGLDKNKAVDIEEFGKEEEIQDKFTEDFLECLSQMGL